MIDISGLPINIEVIVMNPEVWSSDNIDIANEYYPDASLERKREFVLGRLCASEALRRFGIANSPVGVGENREPLWPPGFVGSITHCDGLCAAAVARSDNYFSLGIDAEPVGDLPFEIRDLILTPKERKYLQHSTSASRNMKLIFSAKEAVYKCLFPLAMRYIDFLEVEILIEKSAQRFKVYLTEDLSRIVEDKILNGYWFRSESHLFSAVFIESSFAENFTR